MNKIVVQKLALLTVTVLPLTSLADVVTYERVMVPVFNLPEWLLWGSVAAGFAVVSALMFVAMRRNGRPSMEFVLLETVIAAALTCLLILFKGFFYEERVNYLRPVRRCPDCRSSSCHGQCNNKRAAESRAEHNYCTEKHHEARGGTDPGEYVAVNMSLRKAAG